MSFGFQKVQSGEIALFLCEPSKAAKSMQTLRCLFMQSKNCLQFSPCFFCFSILKSNDPVVTHISNFQPLYKYRKKEFWKWQWKYPILYYGLLGKSKGNLTTASVSDAFLAHALVHIHGTWTDKTDPDGFKGSIKQTPWRIYTTDSNGFFVTVMVYWVNNNPLFKECQNMNLHSRL